MCGIAGFVSHRPLADSLAVIRRMTDIIQHRGPDDFGYFSDQYCHLGHRRLSIVDLSTGQQPMYNEDRTKCIIYNGEIFNHAALRPELEGRGHVYRSRSDTEAVLHAYEEYGPASVNRHNGMFAWALWDTQSKTLYCARDRHGIKPFYYYWDGDTFVFASEIKALLEHPSVSARSNDEVLAEYLAFGFVSSEDTLFQNIHKLPPAHYLLLQWREGSFHLTIEQYWETPLFETPLQIDPEEAIRECRSRLEECVRSRLMADVPLGMFLSGGVDSSAIAAIMRRQFDGPVKTFSVGYQEAEYGELTWAARVAKRIGTEHHEVVIGFDEFFGALPDMVWHEDEPICFSSSIPLYYVSQLASEQVKVVLTGEGSDELFAGYERYRYHLVNERGSRILRRLPAAIHRLSRNLTGAIPSLSLRRKLQHTFLYRTAGLESLYLDNFYCGFPGGGLDRLGASKLAAQDPYISFLKCWNTAPQQSTLNRLLFADHKTYLVELLMKQDQMSMAASIESRVPFLDHTFVEFAMRLPDAIKLPAGGKFILKKAVEDLLPRDIVYRPKMGFPTPLPRWLRESRSDPILAYLCDPNGFLASWFDLGKLDQLIQRHRSSAEDATDRLWRLLNLQVWADVFLLKRDVFPIRQKSGRSPSRPTSPVAARHS